MKEESKGRKTFIMFLMAFLIGFFVVSVVEVLRSSFKTSGPGPEVQVASAVSNNDAGHTPLSFAGLAEKLKPCVVNIGTTKTVRSNGFRSPFFGGEDFFERFFGDIPERQFKQRSLGSGFIISNDGYIFTNNHVVEQADKILVKLSDGKEYGAKLIGKDANTDIALIKIKPHNSLPVAEIGDSDKLKVGEWVLAIGNPFGLEQTVTAGIVSAKGRVIGAGPYDNFIQTDASINPGNSGGPLFSMEGKVVGINTAIVAQGQGIGFAIPISMAKSILQDLKTKGKVTRGWLGVSVQDVTEDIAKSMKIKNPKGALISEVFKGDPADKAGLKPGDIVTEINGKPVRDTHELLLMIAAFHVGDTINITIIRDGHEMVLPIKVAERAERTEMVSDLQAGDTFGMTVHEITPEIAKHLGTIKKGLVVVEVEEGTVAEDVGIQPWDIIMQVNRVKVTTMKEFGKEITKAGKKGSILLLIKRGKATFFVPLMK